MADKKLLFQITPDGYQAILNNERDSNGFKVKLTTAQVIDTANVNRGSFATSGRLIGSDQITLRVKIADSVNTYIVKELRLVDGYGGKVFGRIYREDGSAIDVINPAKFAVIIANIKLSAVQSGSVTIIDSSESDATLAGALDGHIASPAAHKWNAITDKPNLNTGNGLNGGGSLNDPLTIQLSTPSTITATSTNTATANASAGHSHAIDKATTAIAGIVQLNNTLISTSASLALTAAQGKALEDGKVPYTGATKNVDLNGKDFTNTGSIKLGNGSNNATQYIYLGNHGLSTGNGNYSLIQNGNFVASGKFIGLSNYGVDGNHISSIFSDENNAYVRIGTTNYPLALQKTKVNAGNGLDGGGDSSTDRTITLGTPSAITATSTNSVSANSHSHVIDKATTAIAGVVQLNNTLSSSSTGLALTAAQGKALEEKKANWGTTASDYKIGDVYTKTEINPLNISDSTTNSVTANGHTHFVPNAAVGTRGLVALNDTVGMYSLTDAPTMTRHTRDTYKITGATTTLDDASLQPLALYSFVPADNVAGFSGFGYLRTTQYSTEAQMSQIMTPYTTAASPRMWSRHKYGGSWTAWGRIDGANWTASFGETGYIDNKPTLLADFGVTDWVVKAYAGTSNVLADAIGNGVHSYGAGSNDSAKWLDGSSIGALKMLQYGSAAWDSQIATQAYGECTFIRSRRTINGAYQPWKRLDGADWTATEKVAGFITNKPTTWAELAIQNIVNTDAQQSINGAKSFTNTTTFSTVGLVGFSSWQDTIKLAGTLPVIGCGSFGIGFHTINRILYFMDIENQSYLATFNFADGKATFTGALNAAGGLFKGTVEAAYSNVQIQAGTGLTGGGTLATTRALNIDKASAAQLTAGTLDKVLTADIAKPALDAKANSAITMTAGIGLTGGGNLAANRTFSVDKATAAQLTAGTANKVVTTDVLAPFLNKAYVDVTSSRSLGVTYTNNTGYEISVHVDGRVDGGASAAVAYVNGVVVNRLHTISQNGISIIGTFSFVVPTGGTYQVTGMGVAHSSSPYKWVEYR